MDWRENVIIQNYGRALVKPKNQPGEVVLAAEMKHNLQCGHYSC